MLQLTSRSTAGRRFLQALQVALDWYHTAIATDNGRHAQTAIICALIVLERAGAVVGMIDGGELAELARVTAAGAAAADGSEVGGILAQTVLVLTV